MKKQRGISTVAAALATAGVVGGGAAAFAGWQYQNLMHVRGELAETKVQLETANASANAARTQLIAIRKEMDEQKLAFDQIRAERDSARNLLEAEKQHGERVRAELTLAREQVAMLSRRPTYAAPQVVQPQVMRVAPASTRGQAIGVGVPPMHTQKLSPPQ